MLLQVAQGLLLVAFPAAAFWMCARVKALGFLGPVVVCYLFGLAIANIPGVDLSHPISMGLANASVPLAIPLLLFSTDVVRWARLARATVLSFVLACVATVVSALVTAHLFTSRADAWAMSGMLVGDYTGGTVNMSAIGLALKVPNETFLLMNASDVVLGGVYLLFLMTIAQRLLLRFLPAFRRSESSGTEEEAEIVRVFTRANLPSLGASLGLTILLAGLSAGVTWLVFRDLPAPAVLLAITTLGLAASFVPRVRRLVGSYELGEYVLLVFCVAIGSLASVRELTHGSGVVFAFVATVMFGAAGLHFLLAALFRIDADTVLITSTATIFGPPFVGPVAQALKNRDVVVSGLTSGLVGIAVANYLGLATAWLLHH